jgi:NADH-quinone oxidoreductase subunit L
VTAMLMVGAPVVAAALGLLLGRSRPLAAVVAVAGTAVSLALALSLWTQQPWRDPVVSDGLSWGVQPLPFATVVDGLALVVATMVGFVALVVQIYSVTYMRDERRYASYSAFVSLFTAAMLAVVVAGDLLLLVVGWEVMGLCSYLLIGQHWERRDARRAAVKAFLVTKLGDVGFIVGVIVLIGATGTLFLTDAVAAASNDEAVANVASLLILMGVLGKSAQFPLHAWLPDAMAGPSPVSAHIHAATMVAAGIYVVARMYPMFLASTAVLTLMAVIACVTMLGAALAALAQDDLKRVLAWSTVSQLAYMLAALSVGSRDAAVFHLLSHAFFKALLFLAAGAVIHAVGSNLMRDMGGLRRAMPVTFMTMSVGLLALVGVVPLAGFFSKESILVAAEHAAAGDAEVSAATGWLVLVVSVVTIAVTAGYVLRLFVMTFLGESRSGAAAHEAPPGMRWPLVALAVPTLGFGLLGLTASWLPTWMSANASTPDEVAEALTPEPLTIALSAAAVITGLLAAWAATSRAVDGDAATSLGRWRPVLANGFGFDSVYHWVAVVPFRLAVRVVSAVDDRVVAGAVRGAGDATSSLGHAGQSVQRGDAQRYLSAALTGVVVAVVLVLVAVAT